MASGPSDTPGGRADAAPDGGPCDRILPQVTPQEGWTSDWNKAIEKLCAFVAVRYPQANLHALRQRLAPLFRMTVEVNAVGNIEGKKPATVIRDAIVALRCMPREKAVEALRWPEPVIRDYLELKLEAEDAEVDRPSDPNLASDERAARRYALVMDRKNDVLLGPSRGTENPWATVADGVAQLLADVTGGEPTRSWDDYAQADAGWSLSFFRHFAEHALPHAEPPRLDRVWRNALDARKRKIKAAIIAGRK